jgi:hypothetical protein
VRLAGFLDRLAAHLEYNSKMRTTQAWSFQRFDALSDPIDLLCVWASGPDGQAEQLMARDLAQLSLLGEVSDVFSVVHPQKRESDQR